MTYTATCTTSPSLVGQYYPIPARNESVTYALPATKLYFNIATQDALSRGTTNLLLGPDSMVFRHFVNFWEYLHINGIQVIREWESGGGGTALSFADSGLIIKSGSGTPDDPYVAEWYYETVTITWKNHDGTVIDTTQVPNGGVLTHADLDSKRINSARMRLTKQAMSTNGSTVPLRPIRA